MSDRRNNELGDLPARALLAAMREGALVCDSSGRVLGANDMALNRLAVGPEELTSLLDLFDHPQSVADSLRLAMLANDDVPARLTATKPQRSIRLSVRMLDAMSDEGRQYFLMRLHGEDSVSKQLMTMAEKLNRTAVEKEKLENERDKLRNVVDTTIPQLEVLSYEDALTGLGNRRAFDKNLETEWLRLMNSGVPLSVAIIDVDHFKAYNDAYGHPRGDSILKIIARTLRTAAARDCDLVCRIGGEEFAYVLPNTDLAGAVRVAESARERVWELGLKHPTDKVVSVSFGVGMVRPTPGVARREFLERVDAALYRAKRLGRNRVAAAADDEEEGSDLLSG
ncbi:MAG: diguanylate cyclase [Gammaproteobacteria bacterium]